MPRTPSLRLSLGALLLLAASFLLALPGGEARAAVGQADKVTCMYPVWVGFGPVHLANELGYFKDEGIEVEEILDDDMPNGVAAMERGDIDCYLRTVGEYQGLGRTKDTKGQIIGTIGSTGRSTGPHLHWGLNLGQEYLDPATVVGPMPGEKPKAKR